MSTQPCKQGIIGSIRTGKHKILITHCRQQRINMVNVAYVTGKIVGGKRCSARFDPRSRTTRGVPTLPISKAKIRKSYRLAGKNATGLCILP